MQLKNTFLKVIILSLFILTSCIHSTDNANRSKNGTKSKTDIKDLTTSNLNEYYFEYKSIDYDLNVEKSLPKERDKESKEYFIISNQVTLGLDEDWEYIEQNFEIAHVSPFKAILEINTYFQKNESVAKRTETFYYDAKEMDILFNYPIPIEDRGDLLENKKIKEIFKRQVWRGEFDEAIEDIF